MSEETPLWDKIAIRREWEESRLCNLRRWKKYQRPKGGFEKFLADEDGWIPKTKKSEGPKPIFEGFLSEYSLNRNLFEDRGTQLPLLREALKELKSDLSYKDLDDLSKKLCKDKITKIKPKSLVSKVAHFAHPDEFVPMDSFTIDGIKRLKRFKNNRLNLKALGEETPLSNYGYNLKKLFERYHDPIHSLVASLPGEFDCKIRRTTIMDTWLMLLGGLGAEPAIPYSDEEKKARRQARREKLVGQCEEEDKCQVCSKSSGKQEALSARIALFSLLIPDYDEALAFFCEGLGFVCREDTDLGGGKRWVRIAPPGAETEMLLARAVGERQQAAIGEQGGGRVWLFLETSDFETDHARIIAAGGRFDGPPRDEPYGRVAVWCDPWGNRWDLIAFSNADRSGTAP